jgi:membrane associated rhomboid family serine protease
MRRSWNQSEVWGGRERFADSFRGWLSRFGSVTHFIIWATVAVFVVQLLCGFFRWTIPVEDGVRVGVLEFIFAFNGDRFAQGFLWQPVTYMLMHDGIWHILINLLILWFFGREVEYFIGPAAFAKLYVLAGMLGGAIWLTLNFHAQAYLVGASAAVIGCIIAFATLFPNREVTLLVFFVLPVTLKAKYIALIAIAFDVFPILTHAQGNVAHLAHLGGALLGYIYIKGLGYGVTPRWLGGLQTVEEKLRTRSEAAPPKKNLTREEFIRQEVDPILDKISREGMQSLTKHERQILESAKDILQPPRR